MRNRGVIIQPYILLIAFAFYFTTMLSKSIYDQLAKYTDYVIYIAVILCLCLSQYISGSDIKNHLRHFILFFIFGFLSLLWTRGGVGSLLGFVFIPLYLCALEKLQFTTRSKRSFIFLFSAYIIILSMFALHIGNSYSWTLNNYISPNTYGLTCSFCFMYASVLLEDIKMKHRKGISLFLFLLTIYSTWMLDTRMAMYTAVLFLFLTKVIPNKFFGKKMMFAIIIALIIMSVIFPVMYVAMYKYGIDLKIPFTDKSFYTGRERLWSMFFSYMGMDPVNWLVGIGSKVPIYIDTGRSNNQHLHNNTLALITTFGIIGTAMTYSYLIRNIKRIMDKFKEYDRDLVMCLTVFMCFLFEGFTENSMVGVSLFPLFCIGIELDKKIKREGNLL